MMQNVVKVCSASAALLMLSSCGTMKRVVDAIPVPSMPKISLPKLSSVTKIIPGMGGESKADDPVMPFNSKGSLGYGHTLELLVYDSGREPDKLFEGKAMVEVSFTYWRFSRHMIVELTRVRIPAKDFFSVYNRDRTERKRVNQPLNKSPLKRTHKLQFLPKFRFYFMFIKY